MTGAEGPVAAERSGTASELVELQRTLYSSRNPTRRWLHRGRLDRISAAVQAIAAEPGFERALEVGPGAGPYVSLLCDLFAEATATDIEAGYLDHIRREHGDRENLTVTVDDIAHSKLPAGSFDLVLCSEVIEHTPEPPAVLRGIHRLLRPGGALVLSTPQRHSTVEILGRVAFLPGVIQLVRALYREPILPTGHISLLTRRELGRMLDEAGFATERRTLSGMYVPGLAEFGGEAAVRIERRLERRLARGPLAGALWTQYWICRRPG